MELVEEPTVNSTHSDERMEVDHNHIKHKKHIRNQRQIHTQSAMSKVSRKKSILKVKMKFTTPNLRESKKRFIESMKPRAAQKPHLRVSKQSAREISDSVESSKSGRGGVLGLIAANDPKYTKPSRILDSETDSQGIISVMSHFQQPKVVVQLKP